jgi:hypothetical protein
MCVFYWLQFITRYFLSLAWKSNSRCRVRYKKNPDWAPSSRSGLTTRVVVLVLFLVAKRLVLVMWFWHGHRLDHDHTVGVDVLVLYYFKGDRRRRGGTRCPSLHSLQAQAAEQTMRGYCANRSENYISFTPNLRYRYRYISSPTCGTPMLLFTRPFCF